MKTEHYPAFSQAGSYNEQRGSAMQAHEDALEAAQDRYDAACVDIESELRANVVRVLAEGGLYTDTVTAGESVAGRAREVQQPAIDALIDHIETSKVRKALAELVASPAGAEFRRVMADVHAGVNATFVAKARGY